MDSFKKSLRSLIRRLKRDKPKDTRQSVVDPEPPSLPPLVPPKNVGHFDSFVRETAAPKDDSISPKNILHDSPRDTTQQIKPDTDLSHQLYVPPSAQPRAGSPPTDEAPRPPAAMVEEPRSMSPDHRIYLRQSTESQGQQRLPSDDKGQHRLSAEKREHPSDEVAVNESRNDSGTTGQPTGHSIGRLRDATCRDGKLTTEGIPAESVRTDISRPSTGQPDDRKENSPPPLFSEIKKDRISMEEKGSHIEHSVAAAVLGEKVSIMNELPPMKKIVVAPGMSATSGPLEEFPEGGEVFH